MGCVIVAAMGMWARLFVLQASPTRCFSPYRDPRPKPPPNLFAV
uniref:Uncharacterized protein n=1 Tax=Rhizophora mucronata TaxID=61149 RepID=A0A2P2Q095_RHIMU